MIALRVSKEVHVESTKVFHFYESCRKKKNISVCGRCPDNIRDFFILAYKVNVCQQLASFVYL